MDDEMFWVESLQTGEQLFIVEHLADASMPRDLCTLSMWALGAFQLVELLESQIAGDGRVRWAVGGLCTVDTRPSAPRKGQTEYLRIIRRQ